MKLKDFKKLKPGSAVTLASPQRDYFDQSHTIKAGAIGAFVMFMPATTGRNRDFAVIDFPNLSAPFITLSGRNVIITPRCGAFLEELL